MNAENKIYLAYFELKKSKLYYNQLKEHTKLSHSSLQNALNKIVNLNLLEVEKTKSNVFYNIKNKKVFALKFSELAISKFNNLNLSVKNPLKNFLKNISKEIFTIVLFGSSSYKKEKKGSDIDLLIISNKRINLDKNKKEAEITSKFPISLFQARINDFVQNSDDIIIQAKKTGFPISGEQNFYEVILNEY